MCTPGNRHQTTMKLNMGIKVSSHQTLRLRTSGVKISHTQFQVNLSFVVQVRNITGQNWRTSNQEHSRFESGETPHVVQLID